MRRERSGSERSISGDAAVYLFGLVFSPFFHVSGSVCFVGGVARVLMSCSGALVDQLCVGVFALLAATPSLLCQMHACEEKSGRFTPLVWSFGGLCQGSLLSRVVPCIVSMRWFW